MIRGRFAVPDVFLPLLFWLGLMAAFVFLGNGFIARAYDRSPWPSWLWIPACWAPFVLLLRLDRSGRIELLDTEAIEWRYQISRIPLRRRLAIVKLGLLLECALVVADHYSPSIGAWFNRFDEGRSIHLLGHGFSPFELVAWTAILTGTAAAVWQTAFVVRAARLDSGASRKPDRKA